MDPRLAARVSSRRSIPLSSFGRWFIIPDWLVVLTLAFGRPLFWSGSDPATLRLAVGAFRFNLVRYCKDLPVESAIHDLGKGESTGTVFEPQYKKKWYHPETWPAFRAQGLRPAPPGKNVDGQPLKEELDYANDLRWETFLNAEGGAPSTFARWTQDLPPPRDRLE